MASTAPGAGPGAVSVSPPPPPSAITTNTNTNATRAAAVTPPASPPAAAHGSIATATSTSRNTSRLLSVSSPGATGHSATNSSSNNNNVSALAPIHLATTSSSRCHTPYSGADEATAGSSARKDSRSNSSHHRVPLTLPRSAAAGPPPPFPDDMDVTEGSYLSQSGRTTSVGTPRYAALATTPPAPTPPAPVAVYEEEAAALDRAALEAAVTQLRGEVRLLQATVQRAQEHEATLHHSVKEGGAAVERAQENIAHSINQRLAQVKRKRAELVDRLQRAEREKAQQEDRLSATKISIDALAQHIHREEEEGTQRLQEELAYFARQREQLEHVLAAQTASVDELEQLVEAVPRGPGSPTQPLQATGAPPAAEGEGVAAAAAAQVDPYDPCDMLRYLQQEIDTVEGLRAEAAARAEHYTRQREQLEQRVRRQSLVHESQQAATEQLQRQLHDTVAATTEAAVLQTSLEDVASERLFNMGRAAGSSGAVSVSSSRGATPRYRPEALLVPHAAVRSAAGAPAHLATSGVASRSRSATNTNTCSSTPLPEDGTAASSAVNNNNNNTTANLGTSTTTNNSSVSGSGGAPPLTPAGGLGASAAHRTSSISVQDTTRMSAPRPLSSAECTPKKMPSPESALAAAAAEAPLLPPTTLHAAQ